MFALHRFSLVSALGLTALALSHPAAAQTPAITLSPGGLGAESNAASVGVSSYSLGFEFTANSPVFVTSLGYFYDPLFNPNSSTLTEAHQVGLYQVTPGVSGAPESDMLIASASVTSAGTSNGNFLYTSITPTALVTGGDYVLVGVTGATDPYLYAYNDSNGNSAIAVDPAITYVQDRYVVSDTLAYAGSTDPGSEPGFFGPNMQTSPVPEASTTVSLGILLVLGMAGLVLTARRRAAALAD